MEENENMCSDLGFGIRFGHFCINAKKRSYTKYNFCISVFDAFIKYHMFYLLKQPYRSFNIVLLMSEICYIVY